MTTIVVDGQAWSGREEVGLMLANALNWRLVGAEELAAEAERRGYDGQELLDRLERHYGFRRRLEDYLAYLGVGFSGSPGFAPFHYYAAVSPSPEEEAMPDAPPLRAMLPLDLVQMRRRLPDLLREMAHGCVVVGCGAQGALKDSPDVLKVFLVAPQEVRSLRAVQDTEWDPQEARQQVRKVDEGRRAFLKHLYGLSWDDPATYDLVLDTGVLEPNETAALVLRKLGMTARVSIEDEMLDAVG